MRAVRSGDIKICEPLPAPVNHRFEILFKISGLVNIVASDGFAIEIGVNCRLVSINAYLETDDMRKMNDEDQNLRRPRI